MMFTLRIIAYKSWIKRFKVCNFVMLLINKSSNFGKISERHEYYYSLIVQANA